MEPLVPADCDVRDLDGFMLNVERLMASELVALASHEAIAAAMFLWCRAWKQVPAASLPDDDRVIAAFARLPLAKFRKLRDYVMRGFVKCSDGRWYHGVLAAEARAAFSRKVAFQGKRKTEAERLKKWRDSKYETRTETPDETRFITRTETPDETHNEQNRTRFVPEGQGQGQGQGQLTSKPQPESNVADGEPVLAPQAETQRNATRVGALCRRLREIGIDAAPHLPAWGALLPRFSDDEIVAVAESAKAKKPGERLHLHYLVPMLTSPPGPPAIASSGTGRVPVAENFSARDYGEARAL